MTGISPKTAGALSTSSDDFQEDLAVFQLLKPFLADCLTLNHEISNPLAGILGYAEFLEAEAEAMSEEHRRYVDNIMKCAERIKTRLEFLSDLKIRLSESVDIEALIERYSREIESSK